MPTAHSSLNKPNIFSRWQLRLQRFILRGQLPTDQPVQLQRRRIYILPTRYGYAFAALLVVLFLWSVNYSNSMGFAFTFLLAAVAHNSMWQAHDTLLGLIVYPGNAEPVFAGQPAIVKFQLENVKRQPRYGIGIQWHNLAPNFSNVAALSTSLIEMTVSTQQRGWLKIGRIKVLTRFPLGLLQSWSWLDFTTAVLVYPAPRGNRALPLNTPYHATGGGLDGHGLGSEDYAGLRPYHAGDSPRRIAWKAAGRNEQLLVKYFTDQARSELWLDWELLNDLPSEARLEQLCQWVLKAASEGLHYGLRLPDRTIQPNHGEQQRRRCLEALALFGLPQNS